MHRLYSIMRVEQRRATKKTCTLFKKDENDRETTGKKATRYTTGFTMLNHGGKKQLRKFRHLIFYFAAYSGGYLWCQKFICIYYMQCTIKLSWKYIPNEMMRQQKKMDIIIVSIKIIHRRFFPNGFSPLMLHTHIHISVNRYRYEKSRKRELNQ